MRLPTESVYTRLSDHVESQWSKHIDKWTSRFGWLTRGLDGIGCSICEEAFSDSLWARCAVTKDNQVRPCAFDDHEKSAEHQRNIGSVDPRQAALDPETFTRVIDATRKSMIAIPGVMGRHKMRLAKFCIAEAKRRRNRKYILNADAIFLYQDTRKGRLAIRYQLCGPDMEARSGALGQELVTDKFAHSAIGL